LSSSELIQRDKTGLVGVQQSMLLAIEFGKLFLDIPHIVRHERVRTRHRLSLQSGVRLKD
jgi:hypothetical protein